LLHAAAEWDEDDEEDEKVEEEEEEDFAFESTALE